MDSFAVESRLRLILQSIAQAESEINLQISKVHPDYYPSAKNLYRYLILRSYDLRPFHDLLSELGISSLRSGEGYVYSNLQKVVRNLNLLQGRTYELDNSVEFIGYQNSIELLRQHTNALFGENKPIHFTRIMVTLPENAAGDTEFLKELINSGMEVARINLSHGDKDLWEDMIKSIRQAELETGKKVSIYMDLSGPKIRTGAIAIPKKKGKFKKSIPIRAGEEIILLKEETLGKASVFDEFGNQLSKGEITISLPEVLNDLKLGDPIHFDDGMIQARVTAIADKGVEIKIENCFKAKLPAHKGINLPNTKLNLPSLTDTDRENLPFICEHADILGYSFVRSGKDVEELYKELDSLGAPDLGIVLKIENREAFECLPEILLAAMTKPKIGVMIARGDLAVEVGFERISEVQEELLWICEAAHIPVIWATQVLENLAKKGLPTRAEISDAAHGARAECVMLNKGPYIKNATQMLRNVLMRMADHTVKNKNELRALNVSKKFVSENERFKDLHLIQK